MRGSRRSVKIQLMKTRVVSRTPTTSTLSSASVKPSASSLSPFSLDVRFLLSLTDALLEDEAAALSARPASISPVSLIPPTPYTGGTGEKDRAPISHESFLLMANSQTDMDDWVKAIRRVIWAPFGGGRLVAVTMYDQPVRFSSSAALYPVLSAARPGEGAGSPSAAASWWLILTLVCSALLL